MPSAKAYRAAARKSGDLMVKGGAVMKTLVISAELLDLICRHFLTMEPGRDALVDDCLDSVIYDRLKKDFPDFMAAGFKDEDFDTFFESVEL